MSNERVKAIRENSPFPWRQQIHANGRVILFDANGAEVPLFSIIDLACITTETLVRKETV